MNRRNFLKLGALFVPMVAAPTVAYSFLWAKKELPPSGFRYGEFVWDPAEFRVFARPINWGSGANYYNDRRVGVSA